tara:strand:+ start:3641 stop:6166 length:2526 start_codon:yes stop_codon:yes gene_type:complete
MPFIFPKRFLRTRDILDPVEFNQDTEPVQELLDGELDRHNFNAADLKGNLYPHKSLITTSLYDGSVAEKAYYDIQSSSVECRTIFEHGTAKTGTQINTDRKSPNFVKPDGGTMRDARVSGEGHPSVIPNTGAWAAVKNAALSDAMKVSVTTGKASLYINAYVQYVWQGFYEYKKPWAYEGPGAPTTDFSWLGTYKADLAEAEQASLNLRGPNPEYHAWPFSTHNNPAITGYDKVTAAYIITDSGYGDTTMSPIQYDASYAFALNEIAADDEAKQPQLGGYHHISRGFYPALVQFALRVDGKIVDSTITGKSFSFEESAHGLRVDDSPLFSFKGESTYKFGQRSAGVAMSYEADRGGRPGQKIRSTRASSCGPEVLPVRFGGVIPVGPGTHTVEIVARRLLRKRRKFEYGDFVGVFSRRLSVIALPLYAPQDDSELTASPVITKSMQSEDQIIASQEAYKLNTLEDRINSLQPSDIKNRSLPNTHLPSKVKYWNTVGISPSFTIGEDRECLADPDTVIRSRFPGFKNTAYLDKRTATYSSWDLDYAETASDGAHIGAGWQILTDKGEDTFTRNLSIAHATNLKIGPDEKVVIFADVEVRGIHPSITGKLRNMVGYVDDDTSIFDLSNYLGFVQENKYLDLFALFNIGYRTGTDVFDNWIIGSKHAPAVINSSAWANRKGAYIPQFVKQTKFYTGLGDESHDYGGSVLDKPKTDSRGMATAPNNLGITIPLMLTLERSDFDSDADAEITEIAVFGSTTYPSDWDHREATLDVDDEYRIDGDGATIPAYGSASPIPGSTGFLTVDRVHKIQDNQWASPEGGRAIISSVNAHIGRCRLTVMKLYK